MKRQRGDTNPHSLLLSTSAVIARWFLFWIVVMGIGLHKTSGWMIAGGPTALSTNRRHTMMFGNHREQLTRYRGLSSSSSSSALSATCRICRGSYDSLSNEACSCVYHPGSLRGESPRKSDWEEENYDDDGKRRTTKAKESIDNSQLVYTYNCCGGIPDSEGCTKGKHKSFDDP